MVEGLKKVLVIGSGPIIIGQAAEFDYAGTQACRALKEEGLEVVLINSNPATIMTDEDIADRVYVEPISLDYVTEVIEKNGPTASWPPSAVRSASTWLSSWPMPAFSKIQCPAPRYAPVGYRRSGRP